MSVLENRGLTSDQIKKIENEEYKEYSNLNSKINYQNILRELADGYTLEELPARGIKEQDLEVFKNDLEDNNLTVENVKAINQYSNGSNMILGLKRNTTNKTNIKENIYNELVDSLERRNLSSEEIEIIKNKVSNLDYTKPLHENYDIIRDDLINSGINSSARASAMTAVKNNNSLTHVDNTMNELDDALSKSRLKNPAKVYRAVREDVHKVDKTVGNEVSNEGYTSTSPNYDSSFAKYDQYTTVMEMNLPKGTQAIDITRFSDYDDAENEILLNSNDFIITEVNKNVIDKNGKKKDMLKGYALSKNKECYKDLVKQNEELKAENKQENKSKTAFEKELESSVYSIDETAKNTAISEESTSDVQQIEMNQPAQIATDMQI